MCLCPSCSNRPLPSSPIRWQEESEAIRAYRASVQARAEPVVAASAVAAAAAPAAPPKAAATAGPIKKQQAVCDLVRL